MSGTDSAACLPACQQGAVIVFPEAGYLMLGLTSRWEVRWEDTLLPHPNGEPRLVKFMTVSMTPLTSLPPLGGRKHLARSRSPLTSASSLPSGVPVKQSSNMSALASWRCLLRRALGCSGSKWRPGSCSLHPFRPLCYKSKVELPVAQSSQTRPQPWSTIRNPNGLSVNTSFLLGEGAGRAIKEENGSLLKDLYFSLQPHLSIKCHPF